MGIEEVLTAPRSPWQDLRRSGRRFQLLRGKPSMYGYDAPHDANIVACEIDIPGRDLRLLLQSNRFPVPEEGESVPKVYRKRIYS
jgi:hypothetical protein